MEIKCPACSSAGVYFRKTDQSYICKKCGFTWTLKTDLNQLEKLIKEQKYHYAKWQELDMKINIIKAKQHAKK